jgi:hypothetical protein
MLLNKRLGAVAASAIISTGALLAINAAPASATPNFCYGDLCMNEAGQSINTLWIHAWAFTSNFRGHFELQTPEHTTLNSAQKEYYAGGSGPTFSVPVVYGWYCGTAWRYNGGNSYTDIGYECFVAGS